MFVNLSDLPDNPKTLEDQYGPTIATAIREYQRHQQDLKRAAKFPMIQWDSVEEDLRAIDYYNSPYGTLEDLVAERRLQSKGIGMTQRDKARMEHEGDMDKIKDFETVFFTQESKLDPIEQKYNEMTEKMKQKSDRFYNPDEDYQFRLDPNQKAHGPWGELLVTVNRTTKLWRGGRLESYRALVIGGNLNGCAGFGLGKAPEPNTAIENAARACKKNVFFVDRHRGDNLTRDLAGKQNSCKAVIRSTNAGLSGNPLMVEILKYFGIANGSCKAHGNRNLYNVVQATFKAVLTHESLEEMALKRGKRFTTLERAHRMGI
jgi:small subunit ribosomal protein S5